MSFVDNPIELKGCRIVARHLRIEFPGACYHIMNRGNDRQCIFDNDDDFELFIEKLA